MSNLDEDQPPEQFFLNFGVGPNIVREPLRSIFVIIVDSVRLFPVVFESMTASDDKWNQFYSD